MSKIPYKNKETGFAGVEGVLILLILVAIVAVGIFVVHRHSTKTLQSSTSNNTQSAALGTTASVDQITQQDAAAENSTTSSADSTLQQDTASSNTTVSNVGGAYNEANY